MGNHEALGVSSERRRSSCSSCFCADENCIIFNKFIYHHHTQHYCRTVNTATELFSINDLQLTLTRILWCVKVHEHWESLFGVRFIRSYAFNACHNFLKVYFNACITMPATNFGRFDKKQPVSRMITKHSMYMGKSIYTDLREKKGKRSTELVQQMSQMTISNMNKSWCAIFQHPCLIERKCQVSNSCPCAR